LSRKTVSKYIAEYEQALAIQQSGEATADHYLAQFPKYRTGSRHKRRLHEDLQKRIDAYLAQNEEKKRQGLRKQLLLKQDIHQALLKEGYQVGYTTVCNYIRSKVKPAHEVFIRQHYEPGQSCEFDWAEVRLQIAGQSRRLYLAVFTACYSNYRFALLFERQDTLAFQASHVAFFAHCGGVFGQMVYDNMRVAVGQFTGPHEREPTLALRQLSGFYHYRYRFCNIAKGNEKGHVERSVEVVRRKAYAEKYCFATLQEAQVHLLQTCRELNTTNREGKKAQALFAQEKALLWANPGEMSCYLLETLRVDKQATICYKTNHYSVPDHLVGALLEVKIDAQQLICFYQGKKVATHLRSYLKHHWQMQLDHYLTTLSRKPGALPGSVALHQSMQALQELYQIYFRDHTRSFIDLLQYCQKYSVSTEQLLKTVAQLISTCPFDVTADKLMALLGNKPLPIEPTAGGPIEALCEAQLQEMASLFNYQAS
ncbi:MAG: IS21 family transposase, partial [Microcystis aeruginosa Ma_MB_S_20031200_S102D]